MNLPFFIHDNRSPTYGVSQGQQLNENREPSRVSPLYSKDIRKDMFKYFDK